MVRCRDERYHLSTNDARFLKALRVARWVCERCQFDVDAPPPREPEPERR